ncbi:MAG: SDR family NAD(P)-dependent oxidoreductase, partial [Promethearchaeota archaeon]
MVKNFMEWENPGKALITGSSSGIGKEFARQLAEQGFDLILVARREEKLRQIAQELEEKHSVKTEILVADLSNVEKSIEIGDFIKKSENL